MVVFYATEWMISHVKYQMKYSIGTEYYFKSTGIGTGIVIF